MYTSLLFPKWLKHVYSIIQLMSYVKGPCLRMPKFQCFGLNMKAWQLSNVMYTCLYSSIKLELYTCHFLSSLVNVNFVPFIPFQLLSFYVLQIIAKVLLHITEQGQSSCQIACAPLCQAMIMLYIYKLSRGGVSSLGPALWRD